MLASHSKASALAAVAGMLAVVLKDLLDKGGASQDGSTTKPGKTVYSLL